MFLNCWWLGKKTNALCIMRPFASGVDVVGSDMALSAALSLVTADHPRCRAHIARGLYGSLLERQPLRKPIFSAPAQLPSQVITHLLFQRWHHVAVEPGSRRGISALLMLLSHSDLPVSSRCPNIYTTPQDLSEQHAEGSGQVILSIRITHKQIQKLFVSSTAGQELSCRELASSLWHCMN